MAPSFESLDTAGPLRRTKSYRFIDLFAGLGGFHQALSSLGHRCVFAAEVDPQLRELYGVNFPDTHGSIVGDITKHRFDVPPHDILCAGFPCQPFSKSGYQNGHLDTRGTLFHDIVAILKKHMPSFVILENVGNFEQHDHGRTWAIARASLQRLGYTVVATEHVKSGGHGLISPHHLGFPQTRERFFAVCRLGPLVETVLPATDRARITSIEPLLQDNNELDEIARRETALSADQVSCIDHWNQLLKALPSDVEPPSFPLWTDEFGASYPFLQTTPSRSSKVELVRATRAWGGDMDMTKDELLELLPSYARERFGRFPAWKIRFIQQNRDWYREHRKAVPDGWLRRTRLMPPSWRKLEWNCKGEVRDLWSHVLQFRPSGLRVKRTRTIPALVALTDTQVPIIGPRRRYISRVEGLRFQGFPDMHQLPGTREAAFRALGNAVHVGVAKQIAAALLGQEVPQPASSREADPEADWDQLGIAAAPA